MPKFPPAFTLRRARSADAPLLHPDPPRAAWPVDAA
jgi:hypothetical protein